MASAILGQKRIYHSLDKCVQTPLQLLLSNEYQIYIENSCEGILALISFCVSGL